jgi:succinate dehydrogenase / fumarate reductase cytochrome b subunit
MDTVEDLPKAFVWRRLHSLTGLWLVIFLIEHLLTNSQAALLFGDDGSGFVRMVNLLKSMPYLPAIEIGLLLIPIGFHALWGIKILRTAKPNSLSSDGTKPVFSQYSRNHAYTWQRITSWLLIIGIGWHVYEMRFEHYPSHVKKDGQELYMVKLSMDPGLYTVANRLDVSLLDKEKISSEAAKASIAGTEPSFKTAFSADSVKYDSAKEKAAIAEQQEYQNGLWKDGLLAFKVKDDEVVAVANNFGTAVLLMVRDTFKSIWIAAIYSAFVIAAVYHAFNGLWSFCITWGLTMNARSQALSRSLCTALMLGIGFLGLFAIWGTYWLNLRY